MALVLNKFNAAPVEVYSRLTTRQACPVPYTICRKCYGPIVPAKSAREEDTGMHTDCKEETKAEEDKETKYKPVERRIQK